MAFEALETIVEGGLLMRTQREGFPARLEVFGRSKNEVRPIELGACEIIEAKHLARWLGADDHFLGVSVPATAGVHEYARREGLSRRGRDE